MIIAYRYPLYPANKVGGARYYRSLIAPSREITKATHCIKPILPPNPSSRLDAYLSDFFVASPEASIPRGA